MVSISKDPSSASEPRPYNIISMKFDLLVIFLVSVFVSAVCLPTGNQDPEREILKVDDRLKSVCYDNLGCLVTNSSWYSLLERPINVLPLPRSTINTSFQLQTRELPQNGPFISADNTGTIKVSYFKPTRPTKFITHGFLSNGNETWVKELTAKLLEYGDFNVIVVHWPGGSFPPYTQATANTRVVGLEIAHLVNTLISTFGVNAKDVHLIGHSLGAHTSGYAGEKIANLGRITGLDPAGPFFQGLPPFVRLDPTDALFVDAIHTDGKLGYGMMEPVGHLDFYPNGGHDQPGCFVTPASVITTLMSGTDIASSFADIVACSHGRSYDLFIDSISPSSCKPIAYECASNDAFRRGECASCGSDNIHCAPFGIDAEAYPTRDRTNVQLFFDTGKDEPFCRYHYAVKLSLAKPTEARNFVYGKIDFSVSGVNGTVSAPLTPHSRLVHGKDQTFLHVNKVKVGDIKNVQIQWNYITDILQPSTICIEPSCNQKLYVSSSEISMMNNYPEKNRLANTFTSYPAGRAPFCSISSHSACTLSSS